MEWASLLITGGARSGKSRLARAWCEAGPGPRIHVATARCAPDDAEFAQRIAHHRAERGAAWAGTIEEPLDPAAAIRAAAAGGAATVLVDCVTLWISQLGEYHDWQSAAMAPALADFAALMADPPCCLAVVTNEVGSGGVAMHPVARAFTDAQGFANQRLAAAAGSVWLAVSGLPLVLKGRGP
jgi:adenosylcobinamide kinase/adenosylcobinamide-phosphate guanylyltransferase